MSWLGLALALVDFSAPPPPPRMAVSPAARAPLIDGTFDPAEWADANAVSSLAQWGKTFAWPPTVAYVTGDAERLYFAFRCFKDKPQWYRARNRFRDSPVYLDPDVELYFSPDLAGGPPVLYQFCFNAYGAIYDVRVRPEIGLTEPGFNPPIELATSQDAGEWYLEGAIRWADLGLPGGPPTGGVWRANFVRSWPQRAWSLRGGPYLARDAMGELHWRADAPAVQWLDLNSLHEGRLDVTMSVRNKTAEPVTYVVSVTVSGETAADIVSAVTQQVTVAGGETQRVRLTGDATFAGRRGHAELKVSGAGAEPVFYHQYLRFDGRHAGATARAVEAQREPFTMPREVGVSARYGQLAGAVEAQADVWMLRLGGWAPAAVTFAVALSDAPATVVASQRWERFQKDLAIAKLDLPADAPPGRYGLRATVSDAGGRVLSEGRAEFERLDLRDAAVNRAFQARPGRLLDFLTAGAGQSDAVMPPWTPVRVRAGAVEVWGRTMTLAASGLPEQIVSQGRELLAGPVTLRGGRVAKGAPTPVANVQASAASWTGRVEFVGGATVEVAARVEYDGLLQLALRPGQSGGPAELVLEIPLRAEVAQDWLLPTGVGRLPAGTGVVWESRQARDDEWLGTLVPYVWVGDTAGGLTWAADDTRGWVEKAGESVVTLARDASGVVRLQVHLARPGGQRHGEEPMRFALLATPTKPNPAGWRNYAVSDEWNYFWFDGWYGAQRKVAGKTEIAWDDPHPETIERGRQEARQRNQARLPLPYTNPQFTVMHPMPWVIENTSPVAKLLGEDWANMPSRWGPVKPVASYRDWAAANLAWWMEQHGYAGYYIDEAYGADGPDMNLLNGSGWFDAAGRWRGSYHSLDTRELLKRMYVITQRHGRLGRPFLLVHVSSFGFNPLWGSFATAGCFGEGDWEVHVPGESLLDRLPVRTLELMSGKAFGYFGTFFGDKMKGDAGRIAESRRRIQAELLLYDMRPNTRDGDPQAAAFRKLQTAFGLGEPDVRFTGYWMEGGPVKSAEPAVKVSVYDRPGQRLVVAVNLDRQAARHTTLHWSDGAGLVRDAETGERLAEGAEAVALTLPAREARLLWVERPCR